MQINTNQLVSITEANQNFSKVARTVDENGFAVVLKNNVPKYVIMEYSQMEKLQESQDDKIISVAEKVLSKNLEAFKELAK
ncbi:type II toxin-antitoxin system Phd/YefM family antitoxin [Anaeropeptidivorans aminofermentans]|uniref:type II toxin-antitoxin system Phd/YefM family antitoxin n=1 Tax=Anaeropeptidivorans aminofermentans TaxID=2934315 RepID=UPI0020241119|nr:type II toxin-antitoxin system Phd/YefM family antitoxin [Anaeropeptidivorans aminofermentans]